MQDSENSNPQKNESPEPLQEPSPRPSPFMPKLGLRELNATWEMLVKFQRAIEGNQHWGGTEVEAVAMGLTMIRQMSAQYSVQLEVAIKESEAQKRKVKEGIKLAGGSINEKVPEPTPIL